MLFVQYNYSEAKSSNTIGIVSKRRLFKLIIVTNAQLIVPYFYKNAEFVSIYCVFKLEVSSTFPKKLPFFTKCFFLPIDRNLGLCKGNYNFSFKLCQLFSPRGSPFPTLSPAAAPAGGAPRRTVFRSPPGRFFPGDDPALSPTFDIFCLFAPPRRRARARPGRTPGRPLFHVIMFSPFSPPPIPHGQFPSYSPPPPHILY